MKITEKRTIIKEVCISLYGMSHEHPEWSSALRYAAWWLADTHKIPQAQRLWLSPRIPKRRKRHAKKTTHVPD